MAKQIIRVLQLASGDLWAGAEVQLFTLCSQLIQRDDVQLQVALLNEGELASRLRELNIKVHVFAERNQSALATFKSLFSLVRQWRPHVVHTHRFKENVLGGLTSALLGICSVRTVHGAPEFGSKTSIRGRLISMIDVAVGRFLQRRVVAVTDDLRQKLLTHYPAFKVVTIANGVDFLKMDATRSIKLASDGLVIGIVGRLTPVKRLDIFLHVASQLLKRDLAIPLYFYVIGSGPLEPELRSLARTLNIEDRVTFTGHVSPAAEWIKALDILVMCSDHEGMPMTLLEAMRLSTPIVAHRVGGLIELLSANNCAVLVDNHSPDGYSHVIELLIEDPQKRQTLAAHAYTHVTAIYSATANAEKFMALYRQLALRI